MQLKYFLSPLTTLLLALPAPAAKTPGSQPSEPERFSLSVASPRSSMVVDFPASRSSVRLAQAIRSGGTFGDVVKAPEKPPFGFDGGKQGQFIVALALDPRGGFWVGTEDKGVWHCNPSAPAAQQWKQFTTKEGLGDDNAYAIVTDRLGRVWVGHMNHGVSVWNGQGWKNYGVLDGPLGERIFAMTTSPVDGDVWMATSAGLSRYSLKGDSWSHYSRAHGLPSHLATCLAFDSLGTLYIGTQCDGIAISHSDSDYRQWRTVKGPAELPNGQSGEGLPGSMINDLVCGQDDVVYAATTRGLARSSDGGDSWSYVRGIDWKDKLKGLLKSQQPQEKAVTSESLREDYISCLTLDARGLLWIGYRQRGYEVRDPKRDRVLYTSASRDDQQFPYVSSIVMSGGMPILANYGEGLSQGISFSGKPAVAEAGDLPDEDVPARMNRAVAWPTPIKPPALPELNAMLQELAKLDKPTDDAREPAIVAMDDDWTTQGDWLGRYGRYWACLSALTSPHDYIWGAGPKQIRYQAQIGPNADKGDSLRYWVHWLDTDNRRTLEMPPVYFDSRLQWKLTKPERYRRQSEIDDHGEEYPMVKDGPHLYFTLAIPDGAWTLSLYDFNKDGHSGHNRMRDYRLSLRPHPQDKNLADIADWSSRPEWAHGRIRDFWGGVWKRYAVKGPQTLTLEVSRNYSYNTILAGVFLDELNETPAPYFRPSQVKSKLGRDEKHIGKSAANYEAGIDEKQSADRLFEALERMRVVNPLRWASEKRRFYLPLLRWYREAPHQVSPEDVPQVHSRLASCLYQAQMYDEWEKYLKRLGLVPAREIEKSLRWDGKGSYSGRGRKAVLQHLSRGEKRKSLVSNKVPESKGTAKTVQP